MEKERFNPETLQKAIRFMADVQTYANGAGISRKKVIELKKKHRVNHQMAGYLLKQYTDAWESGVMTYYKWRAGNKHITLKAMAEDVCAYMLDIRQRAGKSRAGKPRKGKQARQPSLERQLADAAVPVVWDEEERQRATGMPTNLHKGVGAVVLDLQRRIAMQQRAKEDYSRQLASIQEELNRVDTELAVMEGLLKSIESMYHVNREENE